MKSQLGNEIQLRHTRGAAKFGSEKEKIHPLGTSFSVSPQTFSLLSIGYYDSALKYCVSYYVSYFIRTTQQIHMHELEGNKHGCPLFLSPRSLRVTRSYYPSEVKSKVFESVRVMSRDSI